MTERTYVAVGIVALLAVSGALAGCTSPDQPKDAEPATATSAEPVSETPTGRTDTATPSPAESTDRPATTDETATERPTTERATATPTATPVPNGSTPKGFSTRLEAELADSPVSDATVAVRGDRAYVNYTSGADRTTIREEHVRTIVLGYARLVNDTWNGSEPPVADRLYTTVRAGSGSPRYRFRTERWWAAQYASGKERRAHYVNRTLDTAESGPPPAKMPKRIGKFGATVKMYTVRVTDVEYESLERHGDEFFLTVETTETPGTDAYYRQVVNVSNQFRRVALPRSQGREDGWYATAINIEVRTDGETVEWYRQRTRWAQAVENGELTREQEWRLLLSHSKMENPRYDGPAAD